MNHRALNKKVQLITLSLAIPFQVNLQASVENTENNLGQSHHRRVVFQRFPMSSRKPIKVIRSPRDERQTLICRTGRQTLTPKEKQISDLARCRLFQLQNNNTICQSPSIGLYVVADIAYKFLNGEVRAKRPITLEYDELKQIATQLFPDNPKSFRAIVVPELVHQISQRINKPILYIEVGNRGCSYGPGPIDIAKRLIFARPDAESNDEHEYVEILTQNSCLRDHKLLDTINSYGSEAVIICYNSYLKRTLFSIPKERFTTASESDSKMPCHQRTAIFNIRKNRIIRNVGFFASLATGLYAFKALAWPVIANNQIAQHCVSMKNHVLKFFGSLFGNGSMKS
ncbi:MAG: hypothetical protein LBQ03_01805 [Puniceicoccales bacterium]|jgi:hypothetical protein|nr:hypothetical protein [Puniceicoccales bacterium]